jgi:hypothetical protein
VRQHGRLLGARVVGKQRAQRGCAVRVEERERGDEVDGAFGARSRRVHACQAVANVGSGASDARHAVVENAELLHERLDGAAQSSELGLRARKSDPHAATGASRGAAHRVCLLVL